MSLAGLSSYFVPLSLDGLDAFTQSVQDNALLLDGSNMMLADVNCGTHAVKNMAAATNNDEAVNLGQLTTTLVPYSLQTYVDSQDNLRVLKAGDIMTGSLNMGANAVTSTANPATADHLSRKGYVDSQDNLRVLKAGDTMTGSLNMGANAVTSTADPTINDHLSRKGYVDSQDGLRVLKAGDTMTGQLTVNYTNAAAEIRANNETEDAILFFSTPYQNGAGRRKTAVIADGISSWNRANLHFCLNSAATHDSVTLTDSRLTILNAGNVGLGTTTPAQKLDVNGASIFRGNVDLVGNSASTTTNPTTADHLCRKGYVDSAVHVNSVQTVTSSTFTINDSTPTTTYCNFNGGTISLPATGISSGKMLQFINIYNSSNATSIWSNVGAGSIDGVTGSQQTIRLEYMQSVTLIARGSGAYSTVAINLLPPHARVKCDYNSNAIGFWAWDGVVLNATAKRMQISSSAITGYVPFVPTVWSSGDHMTSHLETIATGKLNGGATVSFLDALWVNSNGNYVDVWCDYTAKSYTDNVSLHCHIGYELAGSAGDVIGVTVYESNWANATMTQVEYYEQRWHNAAGGGTRSNSLFPVLCVFTPTNTTSLNRWIKVRITNFSADDDLQLRSSMHFHITQVKN